MVIGELTELLMIQPTDTAQFSVGQFCTHFSELGRAIYTKLGEKIDQWLALQCAFYISDVLLRFENGAP